MFQDVSYGLRTMAKNPGVTAVAVITLALGIGANTAMFSVMDAVLLRPLAYRDPDRLVTIRAQIPSLNIYWGLHRIQHLRRMVEGAKPLFRIDRGIHAGVGEPDLAGASRSGC